MGGVESGLLAPGVPPGRGCGAADAPRTWHPRWSAVHVPARLSPHRRAVQSLGLLLGLAGFALGFVIAGGWGTAFTTHRNLGLAATVFGVLQVGPGAACRSGRWRGR